MPHKDTEPFEQLVGDEDVESARQTREDHKRRKKHPKYHRQEDGSHQWPKGPTCDGAEDTSDFPHPEGSMSPLTQFLLSFVSDLYDHKGYRIIVTASLAALFMIAGASYGLFERFGVNGFARADVIKSKIEDATLPLETKINKQIDILDRLSQQVTEQLAAGTASEIRAKIAKRCMEPPNSAERSRLNDEVYRLQQQYRSYKPEYYREPQCSEL